MSSDLLKEFGAPEISWTDSKSLGVTQDAAAEDDDEFGEFEESEKLQISNIVPADVLQQRAVITAAGKTGMTVRPEILEAQKQHAFSSFSEENRAASDGDDFGGFGGESVLFDSDQALVKEGTPSSQKQIPSRVVEPTKVSVLPFDQQKPIVPPVRKVAHRLSDQYDYSQDEIWEPTDVEQEPIMPGKAATSTTIKPSPELEPSRVVGLNHTMSGPPPSNIPPPSVLLPLIARHFQSLSTDVKNIAPAQRLSPEPSKFVDQIRVDRIQMALAVVRAGAHVLAGRKLRWKRDNLLSQSMKIGPANGRVGGMKLAGVDKSESRREDQEAVEALNVWRKHIGYLRSTISTFNAQHSEGNLKLPEISENMPIRVVKQSEGAVTAPKACFLCGIRRDERVAKVDVDVEDSFGEWWYENWGHVDCVALWENHRSSLPQR